MQANLVKAIYNITAGNGVTCVLVPALAGTNTETAGITLTAGAGALIYNPTVAAGFTTLQATAVETADFILASFVPDTLSALGTFYFRFGSGLATAETIFERQKVNQITIAGQEPVLEFRTRRRVSTAGNSRISASVASAAGGSETMAGHVAILRGV